MDFIQKMFFEVFRIKNYSPLAFDHEKKKQMFRSIWKYCMLQLQLLFLPLATFFKYGSSEQGCQVAAVTVNFLKCGSF
jgi:hypothetical protein